MKSVTDVSQPTQDEVTELELSYIDLSFRFINNEAMGKKPLPKIILVLVILVFALSLFTLKTIADLKVAEGNKQLAALDIKAARDSYIRAKKFWPFVTKDVTYQQNMQSINNISEVYASNPVVTVSFKRDTPEDVIQSLLVEYKTMDGVREVVFSAQQEPLTTYLEGSKEASQQDTINLYPATIVVYTRQPATFEYQEELAAIAKNKSFVEQVESHVINF